MIKNTSHISANSTPPPSNWVETTLGKIGKTITGKTPSTKEDSFWNGKIPFITPTDINNDSRYCIPARTISEKGKVNLKTSIIPPNAICYTSIASIGLLCISKQESLTNQQINSLIVNRDNDYLFFYYYLKFLTPLLKKIASGTTTHIINKTQFENFSILIPLLNEQRAITSILSAFDDKIELLREQNKTLEDMGRVIFQEWFGKYGVDDLPTKTSAQVGELPEGWRVGKLGELVLDSIGGNYGQEIQDNVFNIETLCLRGTDLPDMKSNIPNRAPIRFVKDSKLEKCKLLNGDIVIEISGGTEGQSTGRSIYINDEIINRSNLPMTCVNFCRIIRPRKIEFSYFIYSYLEYLYNLGIFFNLENGSTGIKNLNLKVLLNDFNVILPNEDAILNFDLKIKSFFEKIQYNNSQIQSLTRIRDELLSKLMSGLVRVNDFSNN